MEKDNKEKAVQDEPGEGIKKEGHIYCSLCKHRLLDATVVKDGKMKCPRCRKMVYIDIEE